MSEAGHVTSIDLDLIVLGQASPEQVARVAAHGACCPACAALQAEYLQRAQHFRTSVFQRTAPRVIERGRRWAPARLRWLLAFALSAMAGLALLARGHHTHPSSTDPTTDSPVIGVKGAPALQVFVRRRAPGARAGVSKVHEGDRLAAGDALRFVLLPTGLPYVLIASVDGAAQVSIYYPFHGETSAEVDGKSTVSVPDSIVLDKAPGPERIFVIHSERPVPASLAREVLAQLGAGGAAAIRAARRLPIEGTLQSTLLFEKETER